MLDNQLKSHFFDFGTLASYFSQMAAVNIPKQQKAAIKVGSGADAKAPVQQIEVPTPGPSEILVKINWQVLPAESSLRLTA